MNTLREILDKFSRNEISVTEAEKLLRLLSIAEIEGMAKIDPNRACRKGIPEIILAEGKTTSDLVAISLRMLAENGRVIISRCNEHQTQALSKTVPDGAVLTVKEKARMIIIRKKGCT